MYANNLFFHRLFVIYLDKYEMGTFRSGQTFQSSVIQKTNSTPLLHKHQLFIVELLLSRP